MKLLCVSFTTLLPASYICSDKPMNPKMSSNRVRLVISDVSNCNLAILPFKSASNCSGLSLKMRNYCRNPSSESLSDMLKNPESSLEQVIANKDFALRLANHHKDSFE